MCTRPFTLLSSPPHASPLSPCYLTQALIRPGRFDRHVVVPNPDVEGRRQILERHFKDIPRGPDVDLKVVVFL